MSTYFGRDHDENRPTALWLHGKDLYIDENGKPRAAKNVGLDGDASLLEI